jgi:hypothetical protein
MSFMHFRMLYILLLIFHTILQGFSNFFFVDEPLILLSTPRYTPASENEKEKKNIKRWLLAHGDYSNISNCRTKILVIFRGLFIIFLRHFKIVIYCIYFTISRGTTNGVLWNPI